MAHCGSRLWQVTRKTAVRTSVTTRGRGFGIVGTRAELTKAKKLLAKDRRGEREVGASWAGCSWHGEAQTRRVVRLEDCSGRSNSSWGIRALTRGLEEAEDGSTC